VKDKLIEEIREIKNAKELESFINKNGTDLGELNWHMITKSSGFSLKMINKYSDHLDWQWLCTFYDLTEEVMDEYSGYLDWYSVSSFQKLSFNFIKKYKDVLSMDKVIRNDYVIKMNEHEKIYAMYQKMNQDKKYQDIWKSNLQKNSLFRPMDMPSPIKKAKSRPARINMSKDQIKKILSKRGIKVMYHDTLDVLRKKMKDSDKK
jgi:hypothetical protein